MCHGSIYFTVLSQYLGDDDENEAPLPPPSALDGISNAQAARAAAFGAAGQSAWYHLLGQASIECWRRSGYLYSGDSENRNLLFASELQQDYIPPSHWLTRGVAALRKALQVQTATKPGLHKRWLAGTERVRMSMTLELETMGLVKVARAYCLNRNSGAALAVVKAFVAERPQSPWLGNAALLASEALFKIGRYNESMEYMQWVQQREEMLMQQQKQRKLKTDQDVEVSEAEPGMLPSLTLVPLSTSHLSLLVAFMHEVLAEELGKDRAHELLYRQALHSRVEQLMIARLPKSPQRTQKLSTSALFSRSSSHSSEYDKALQQILRGPKIWHSLGTALRARGHYNFAAQVQDKLLPLLWSGSPSTLVDSQAKSGPVGPYDMWHSHRDGPREHPVVSVQAVLAMSDTYHVVDRPLMAVEVLQRLAYPYAPWDPTVHRRLARDSPDYAIHFGLLYVVVDWVQKAVRGKHERQVLFKKRLTAAFLQSRLRGILGRREADYQRKRRDAPIHFQRLWRGIMGREKAEKRRIEREREINSVVLQQAFRVFVARKELHERRRIRAANFIQRTVRRLAARRVYAAKRLRRSELERLLPGIGRRVLMRQCLHAMRVWQNFCFESISAGTHLAMLATSLTYRLGLDRGNLQAAKQWQQRHQATAVSVGSAPVGATKPRSVILPKTTRFGIQSNFHLRSPEGCQGLARALRSPACMLKELSVTYCGVGDAGATAIAQALATCRLRALDLKGNSIGDEGCVALALSLKSVRGHPLRSLCLSVNEIGRDNNTQGAQALARALKGSCSLVTLKLNCNQLRSSGMRTMCTALKDNKTLERLDLYDNHSHKKAKSDHLQSAFKALVAAVTSRAKRKSRLAEVTLSSHPMLNRLLEEIPELTVHSVPESTTVKFLEDPQKGSGETTESKQVVSDLSADKDERKVDDELQRMRQAIGMLDAARPDINTSGLTGSLLDVDVDLVRANDPSASNAPEQTGKQQQYVTRTIHYVRLFCL